MSNVTGTVTVSETSINGTVSVSDDAIDGAIAVNETAVGCTVTVDETTVSGTVTLSQTGISSTVTVEETIVAGTVGITSPTIAGTYGPVLVGDGTLVRRLLTDVLSTGSEYVYPEDLKIIIPAGKHCTIKVLVFHVSGPSENITVVVNTDGELGSNYFIQDASWGLDIAQSLTMGGVNQPPSWHVFNDSDTPRGFYLVGAAIGGASSCEFSIGFAKTAPGPSAAGFKAGSYVEYTLTD